MTEPYQKWMDYIEIGENGWWKGIREDAPDWAKEEYKKYKARRDKENTNGVITK